MIDIELIEDLQDLPIHSWNALLDTVNNGLPFQRYEWIDCWWRVFRTPKIKLWIMLAKKHNELIGIAPLMYRKINPWRFNLIEFIGTGYFDYFDFIIKKGEEEVVLNSFINYLNKSFANFELALENIFEVSPTFKILSSYIRSKILDGLFCHWDSVPFIELPKDKEGFGLQIKKRLRTDLVRQQRRLEELGGFEFKRCGCLSEASNALENFFYLHIKKWESSDGYSVYKFKSRRIFLRDLTKYLFDKKIVNVYYLSNSMNRTLAVCFTFETDSRLLYFAPAYEPEFAKYSPGKILISKLIDYAIDNQYSEFDFGIGSEPYKLEWNCEQKRLYHISVFTNKSLYLKDIMRLRRNLIHNYDLNILPLLRKLSLAKNIWRRLNRKKGKYVPFE